MTKLTTPQHELLTVAAEGQDGSITAPDAAKTAAALIKKGLFISIPQPEGPSRLLITTQGREAIAPAGDESSHGGAEAEVAPTSNAVSPEAAAAPKRRTKKFEPVGAPPARTPAAKPKGKIGALVELLRQPNGATVEAMMAVTGWQRHSVRGALSGAVKKGLGLTVLSDKTEAGRIYRIPAEVEA